MPTQRLTQRFLALAAFACGLPAFASLTNYATLSDLETNNSGDTFSNITFAQGNLGTSTTVGGFVFSVNSPQLTGIASPSGWTAGTAIDSTYSSFYTITITVPSAVNAIGVYADGQSSGSVIALNVSDGTGTLTPSYTQSGSTPGFFGYSTTGSFTNFTVTANTAGGPILTVGDVTFGEPNTPPTPEVATFLLVGTGLFTMGYFRRRAIGLRKCRAVAAQPLLAGASA